MNVNQAVAPVLDKTIAKNSHESGEAKQVDIKAAVGDRVNGRNWLLIYDALEAWVGQR